MDPGSSPIDGSGDLSFDLLFTDNSSSSSSNDLGSREGVSGREDHIGKQPPNDNAPIVELSMKFGTSHPDDSEGSMGLLSMSAPQSGSAGARRRTRSRKRTTTLCKNEKDAVVEKEKLSIFIYTCNAKKLRWSSVIQLIDDRIREPREFYYRENQCFGFIQFQQVDVANRAVELLNDVDVGGSILGVERCTRGCPGRDDTTPLVKNSILVIKNLPYNMKEEKLKRILQAFEEQRPEDVSFHHDSSGTFRGMAFVKYSSIQDAAFVFDHINSIDVGGRPIKVEYKRKPDPSDEDHQKIQQQLQHFKDNDDMSDLAFPFSLSNSQRKQIHSIAEKLGLRYQSYGENENRYIIVSKKKEDDGKSPHQIPRRKTSGAASTGSVSGSWNDKNSFNAHPSSQKYGSSWSNDRASTSYESSPKFRVRSYSTSKSKSTNKSESVPASPSFPSFVPQREPKGPDGTVGFGEKYRQNRMSHVTAATTTAVTIES